MNLFCRHNMKRLTYRDGTEIHVGDRVFYNGQPGRVAIAAEHGEYAPDYPKEVWPSITAGVMIHFDNGARASFELPDEHFSRDRNESLD